MLNADIIAELLAAEPQTDDIPCKPNVIASLFGLTVRRIQQLTQEGVIDTSEVKVKGRKVRRYLLIDTVMKYIAYLSDKAYGKDSSERLQQLKEQKLKAEIALKEVQGELQSVKRDIAIGKYIDVKEAELDYINFFVVFKKFCLAIPGRVAGRISGRLEPTEARAVEKEINEEITSLLESFCAAGISAKDVDVNDKGKI